MSEPVVIGVRVVALALAVALMLPASADAQRPGGPFSGLFGRTPPRTGQALTRVEVRSSIAGQHDSFIPAAAVGPGGLPSGAMAAGAAGLNFDRRRDRLDFRGKGEVTYQKFFQEDQPAAPTYDAAMVMHARPATRFSITANARATRSPFFQLTLAAPLPIPFLPIPVAGGDAARRMKNDTFEGEAGFTSQFTKRSSIGATLIRRDVRFADLPGRDYGAWGSRADFRHRVSKHSILRASYTREQSRQQLLGDDVFIHELIDVGVDTDRDLSITRHTSLAFYTQTSILRAPGGPRRFRLNGGATLAHDFQRTWNAAVIVNRDTELHPGFVAPLFSDGVTVALGGMPTARTEFTVNASARRGHVGFDATNRMNSQSAVARVSTGITTKTGLFCQYTYYRYELLPGATVVELLPRSARQQFSIGVTMWLPVYSHVRAPRDPR